MRPNERLNASLNLHINDIDLPGVSYVSTLATARVNYSFSTSTFLNALLQYSTDTKQLSSNVRFNIIHRPLSDLFLVYNERRDERRGTKSTGPSSPSSPTCSRSSWPRSIGTTDPMLSAAVLDLIETTTGR